MTESTESNAPRERELHELLSRDMVDLYVGSENTHWVLHEKLLCHRSAFFRQIFYNKGKANKHNTKPPTAYGLPDEDDSPFRLFVAWLYADVVPSARVEADLAPLLDLYLMGEKWKIDKLRSDVLAAVRRWYHDSDSSPGLRRVQYVYANTALESPLRRLMVDCVARMLVCEGREEIPSHWDTALRRDGQLAVDVILAVQRWRLDGEAVPDPRNEGIERDDEDEELMEKTDGEEKLRIDEKIQMDEEETGDEDLTEQTNGPKVTEMNLNQ